ncbi:hypothetical protein CON64_12980 [Bacillus pseudomycoides]|nr:hypothetical protein CON64_12980 [Bacillus pseudomycoides]
MQKVMVVGASGVLGRLVCIELLRVFDNQVTLVVTDYKEERGKKLAESIDGEVTFKHLDVTNIGSVTKTIKDVDLVVVVVKQQHPYIQKACIDNRIVCIDVTPFSNFVEKVKLLHQDAERNDASSIVMSGFFPGLSGLMVNKAVSDYHTTTMVTAALAKVTLHSKVKGVVYSFEITDLDEVLSEINCKDIVLNEFIK